MHCREMSIPGKFCTVECFSRRWSSHDCYTNGTAARRLFHHHVASVVQRSLWFRLLSLSVCQTRYACLNFQFLQIFSKTLQHLPKCDEVGLPHEVSSQPWEYKPKILCFFMYCTPFQHTNLHSPDSLTLLQCLASHFDWTLAHVKMESRTEPCNGLS